MHMAIQSQLSLKLPSVDGLIFTIGSRGWEGAGEVGMCKGRGNQGQ
jgi:hypothetical protein